jgi:hypothetical protein
MIVNIRGTHGSGKSTVVKKIMGRFPTEVEEYEERPRGRKALVYRVFPKARSYGQRQAAPLYVIGNYDTACGGCDGIQPYDRIWPLVYKYGTFSDVLFEGALVSSSYGNIGRSSEEFGKNFVFAFMDTPLEICLERVRARRLAKGNEKPLDPKNTTTKWNHVMESIPKIRDEFGRVCTMINHERPVRDVMKLYGVHLRNEP